MVRALVLSLGLLSRLAPPLAAQTPTPLGRPDAALPDAFSSIRGVRELPGGKVLVADWIEERVAEVDLDAGTIHDRVPRGPGPDEIRLPSGLVPMPGDSTLLVDLGNGRLSVLPPVGRVARTVRADRPGLGGVRGVDAQGGLWYAVPGWAAGPDALPDDSVRVVRMATDGSVRPVAVVQGSRMRRDQSPSREPRIPIVGYAAQDAWLLRADGALVVVRGRPFRVEVTPAGGTPRVGPELSCAERPVTPADREAFIRDFMASSPTSGRGPDGGMGHSPVPDDAAVARLLRSTEFAETHPCFSGALLAAPGGRVWVGRGAADGAVAPYDVFDADGRRLATVVAPPGRRIVAVGARGVYAVLTDEMGLETLERYPNPVR